MARHGAVWLAIFGMLAVLFLQLPPIVAKQDAVVHTYAPLVEVDALIKQRYVDEVDSRKLVDGSIRGMLYALDPYSRYIAPDELSRFERTAHGTYTGIGLHLGHRLGQLTVIAPIEGGPAAKAGVRPGDRLLEIDDHDTKGLSVLDADDLLRGAPGTPVVLRCRQPDEPSAREVVIKRGPVSLHTVRGWRRLPDGGWDFLIDPDRKLGYIRVSGFHERTLDGFDKAIQKLRAQGAEGLVLDLRFNPGGLMEQAVGMVDRFVAEGEILSTVTRREAIHRYQATEPNTVTDMALAVLINDASASSSEIVAGGLQDHNRAEVVGTRSFGKGSVQHLAYLRDRAAAVRLTVAYYRLPGGRLIHRHHNHTEQDAWGVLPDLVIPLDPEERDQLRSARARLDYGMPGDSTEAAHALTIAMDRQLLAALDAIAPTP